MRRPRPSQSRLAGACGWTLAAIALLASGTAYAGDKPLYAAAPTWVKPSPPIDAEKATDSAGPVLLYDNQQRLEDGQVWTYIETATRAVSPEMLSSIGTLQLPWQPQHGDLIIHKVEIIRGAEHIDLIKGGQPFSVLRREEKLEQQVLTGTLTATMPIEGLRVGDVVHIAVSITLSDQTLKGRLQAMAITPRAPIRIGYARQRFLWPEKIPLKYRALGGLALAEPVTAGGYRELTIPLPIAKAEERPKDAPARFQDLPLVEATDFADWAQVSATMAPLYATDGLIDPNGPIAAEVTRIMAASQDPLVRTADALRLVQDKIRYQLVALNTGNYVPQTPAQTWALRYGDCKAKTLLLLAILHRMGIEAEPVLASLQLTGFVTSRLPSAAVFDHVFVKATVGGQDLWLDGTARGARLADIHDVPPYQAVLPLRTQGATLIELPHRVDARPNATVAIDLDSTAGLRMPATFRFSMTVRSNLAVLLQQLSGQGSKDDIDKQVDQIVTSYIENAAVATRNLSFDDAAGTATVTVTGVGYPDWSVSDERLKSALYSGLANINFDPDRARTAWRAIPVSTGESEHLVVTTRTRLPDGGKGYSLEGDTTLDTVLAAHHLARKASLDGPLLTVTVERTSSGEEIAAADIPAERKKLADARSRTLRGVAPADYPGPWQEIVAAKQAHRMDPIIAVYTKRIADQPTDAVRYTDRAWAYEKIYERDKAIADLSHAITMAPDAPTYLRRAALYRNLGQPAKALADLNAAIELDPKSSDATVALADLKAEMGQRDDALALVQPGIDAGGDTRFDYITEKAQLLADQGDTTDALSGLDTAIAGAPGRPDLLNSRCWIKGTYNVALDTALKDCTKAIELSDSPVAALDSRAMVYFRLNRMDDALADLNAALMRSPDLAASLYMRGVIRRQTGSKAEGDADIAAARGIFPRVDVTYRKFGITTP